MEKEFVDKNKRLLKIYCRLVELLGYVLVLAGMIWFVTFIEAQTNFEEIWTIEIIIYAASRFSFDFFFIGLVAVVLAQLTRYVFEREYKRGLMLRCGEKIFYLFAAFEIFWTFFRYQAVKFLTDTGSHFLFVPPLLLPTAAKVLVLVGLAQVLRRVMLVIEESKTLV